MPVSQATIHQELTKLLLPGYTVTGDNAIYLLILSSDAVMVAQADISR